MHVESLSEDNTFNGVEGVVESRDCEVLEGREVPDRGDGEDGGPFPRNGEVALEEVPVEDICRSTFHSKELVN